jgi:superfamily II DNA or RNA helicase
MELRPHQVKAIEMIRHSLKTGHKRPLLAAPCSFGKTITAAWLMKAAADKGRRCVFFCDRVKLLQQTIDAMESLRLDFGVMQAQHHQTDYSKPIQIASIQTVARRDRKPEFDLAIVDECFVAGTMIATPTGLKPIELVRCGDTVYNLTGTGRVEGVSIKPAYQLVKLRFDNGTIIECTENHPFFTEKGWVKAGELESGSLSFSIKGMSRMWQHICAESEGGGRDSNSEHVRKRMDQAEALLREVQDEFRQPHVGSSGQTENEGDLEGDKAQADQAWWKRAAFTLAAASTTSCAGSRVGSGDGNCNTDAERFWVSDLLQNRYSESGQDDRDRTGRLQSLQLGEESTGCEENGLPDFARLVDISRIKCESPRAVYNFSVSGHPSYFANGLAVHNCHTAYDSLTQLMQRYDQVPFIGLSATPYSKGLGKIYDDLLVPITTQELLDQGYLCPVDYYGGRSVSTKGIKTKVLRTGGSDYDPDALAEAIENDKELAGDIVKNWMQHGVGQTIAFSPSIKHSKYLVDLFLDAGISAAHIDGYMDEEERKRLFKAHDDGTIKILSCSRLLNTGYDAPTVRTLIDCFSTRSKIVFQQRAGRIFRTALGKDKAIYLDHAGNVARHGFAESLVPSCLDDGEQNFREERQIKERDEKETRVQTCPLCQRQMAGIRCACGYMIPIREQLETDGSMLQRIEKTRTYSMAEKSEWYSSLLRYARLKGYSEGWAAHKYREKFTVWPRSLNVNPNRPMLPEVEKWLLHKQIKWSKGREAHWMKD